VREPDHPSRRRTLLSEHPAKAGHPRRDAALPPSSDKYANVMPMV
jgi:hypothetical protein